MKTTNKVQKNNSESTKNKKTLENHKTQNKRIISYCAPRYVKNKRKQKQKPKTKDNNKQQQETTRNNRKQTRTNENKRK